MGEFDLIARYLRPLAGDGSEALRDDAARAFDRVLTKDVLVEGVHFLKSDPVDLIARKALRVNMSDLIAKAAQPTEYMLGIVWPDRLGEADFQRFAYGLEKEHADHGLTLLGGDTTSGPVLMISVTMFGTSLREKQLLRSGGKAGDVLVVTGIIGAGMTGLEAARSAAPADHPGAMPYRLPEPPFSLAPFIAEHATASLDVSDGLLADAQHLAAASEVTLTIDVAEVPLAEPAVGERRMAQLSAGDDYQTLFLMPEESLPALEDARREGLAPTVIGQAQAGENGRVILTDGEKPVPFPQRVGWDHFDS
ncbi:MAG: thiamine-phosphate kinase [Pseudomonadota bacterium]